MKRALIIGALLLVSGCANPDREPKVDCETDRDPRCVLCVTQPGGGADWYFRGPNWDGCPKGTILVQPWDKKEG